MYNCHNLTDSYRLSDTFVQMTALAHLDLSKDPREEEDESSPHLNPRVSGDMMQVLAKLPHLHSLDISG